jgi:hypothetical protein
VVQSQSKQIVHKTLFQKYLTQKGLGEWLKVQALSLSPSTTKKGRGRGRGREGRNTVDSKIMVH